MTWLCSTPRAVVLAHMRALDCLQARESLAHAAEVGVGEGVSDDSRSGIWDEWRRVARLDHVRPAPASTSTLASAGIAVKVVPVKGK